MGVGQSLNAHPRSQIRAANAKVHNICERLIGESEVFLLSNVLCKCAKSIQLNPHVPRNVLAPRDRVSFNASERWVQRCTLFRGVDRFTEEERFDLLRKTGFFGQFLQGLHDFCIDPLARKIQLQTQALQVQ